MSETPLDQAIDAVAREMTALDAPAGMRAEVLARIESAPRPGSAVLPRWALAAGVAVLVLTVATALWVARPGDRPESATARHDTSSTPAAVTTPSQPQPSGNLVSAGLETGGTAKPVARGVAAVQPDENVIPTPEMGPTALARLDPIVIPELGPEAIHIPDIDIEPLGDLKPITIPDISVGSGEPHNPSIQR
ncbi:MAG: hypothetical protein NTV05_15965 [Acidobacteria bacterium]|nr:hypothetical protein [Acidobacteriota bacterium]